MQTPQDRIKTLRVALIAVFALLAAEVLRQTYDFAPYTVGVALFGLAALAVGIARAR